MNQMKNIYRTYLWVFSLLSLLFLGGCISDDFTGKKIDTRDNDLYLFLKVPDNIDAQTRGLSESDNYKIDLSSLKILLFKDGKYKGDVPVELKDSSFDDQEKAYKIKISDLARTKEIVDFVVVANHAFSTPSLGTDKHEFYSNLTFESNGKWDTSTPRLLPFWGESVGVELNENLGTRYSATKFEIKMLRSVARIDFMSSVDPSSINPAAYGLEIKSISVYNSLNKGLIAADAGNLDENLKPLHPSVLGKSVYNTGSGKGSSQANVDGLKYTVSDPYKFSSEIFIPEQELKGKDKSSVLTFVVGGQIKGGSRTTYYRVDLHVPRNGGYEVLDVLRNHRYIINILGVRGNGASSEEAALKSSSHNIEVDVVEWDESINEGFIYGDKYLGVNSSELYFPEHTKGQELGVPIQTNLNLQEIARDIKVVWSTGGLFKAEVIEGEKLSVKITTLTDNLGADLLSDVLSLEVNSHVFQIKVSQNTEKLDFDLLCEAIGVKGVYQKNIPLTASNYILVKLRSEVDHSGYRYEVSTDRIDNIEFKAQGKFNMTRESDGYYYQTVALVGQGTARSTVPKYMTIIPNSKKYQTCSATVKMAYGPKNIVGIGWYGYGYGTDEGYAPGTYTPHSYRFRKSPNNFGLLETSTVKSVPLANERFTRVDGYTTTAQLSSFTAAMSKNPDILIWGYASEVDNKYTQQMTTIVVDYIKKGGTVIYMSETRNTIQDLFSKLYQGTPHSINMSSKSSGGSGTHYPFITQPGDVITDGPFGSVHGKYWGEDASITKTIIGVPSEDVVVYSGSVPAGTESKKEDVGVTIFRHTKYNLFFIGDAGFISQSGTSADMRSSTICPFLVDSNDRPIPKPDYGKGSGERKGTVYNAIFFANVLAWAVDRAEFHGINSDK